MAKRFKLPKKINGFALPKGPRKQANRLIAKLQGEELEALLGVVVAAVIAHFATRGADTGQPLGKKLAGAVESHLRH